MPPKFPPSLAKFPKKPVSLILCATLLFMSGSYVVQANDGAKASAAGSADAASAKQKAALTVQVTRAQSSDWKRTLSANGSISAWHEALIGAALGGYQLAEVNVNVGDKVKRGQVLARFASESVAADVAQAQAALEEAQASLEEAEANAVRAASLTATGAMSTQLITQYQTAQKSAKAKVQSARARLQVAKIRLTHVQVLAPDDGVISARMASVGSVAQQGQELFKMLRNNRLEWRAEVNANELRQIKPGMMARLVLGDGSKLEGTVRILAPTIDAASRNALVYVDLPIGSAARAGMFATGQFELGQSGALTLPQSAVVQQDGFGYAFEVGKDGRVRKIKLELGRRQDNRVEVLKGITPQMDVVTQGAGFLADGDAVRVVPNSTPGTATNTVVAPSAPPAAPKK